METFISHMCPVQSVGLFHHLIRKAKAHGSDLSFIHLRDTVIEHLDPTPTIILAAEADQLATVRYLVEIGARVHLPPGKKTIFSFVSSITRLWSSWGGLEALLSNEIFATLKLLMRSGVLRGDVENFLVSEYHYMDDRMWPPGDGKYRLALERWGDILDLLFTPENLVGDFAAGVSSLLFQYLDLMMYSIEHCSGLVTRAHRIWRFRD